MKKNLLEIRDFVKSLENGVLSQKQEAVLLVGESEDVLGLANDGCSGGLNHGCHNNNCRNMTNNGCTNTGCTNCYDNDKNCGTSTGGGPGTGGGHGTSGAPGIDAGLMGFPGFNF